MTDIDGMGITELLRLRVEIAAEIRKRKAGKTGLTLDKANRRRLARAVSGALEVMDRRRFIIGPVPGGKTREVEGLTGSLYPNMVRDPGPLDTVLKDGDNVQKLGGQVLVGALLGAKLVSLALEERTTCPRSCGLWDACYTNGMPQLVRYRAGDALLAAIEREVAELCDRHEKVLVRLHMAGDFYSLDYLALWERLLFRHWGLHVFGFTAHGDDSVIGRAIASIRDDQPERFAIRHSGRTGRWGSFTVPLMAEDRAMIGDAVVCPEQRDAMKGFQSFTHCGSCGLCWKADEKGLGRPIVFIEH